MEEKTKRLLLMSILAYAVGTFLLAAGLLTKTFISILLFYIISILLIGCAIMALYNNYKQYKQIKLYLYLIYVGVFFIVLNCLAFINNL